MQSLLFARYTVSARIGSLTAASDPAVRAQATSSPDNGGPNNAPPRYSLPAAAHNCLRLIASCPGCACHSSSKKPPTSSASPYSQGRPAPSGFGARGDLSLASPEPAPLSASGTRPRARAPPRKSVLDERNGSRFYLLTNPFSETPTLF